MNRKNFAIRALSVLLCTLMLVGMIPFSMSAAAEPVVLDAEDITIVIPEALSIAYGLTQSYDVATGVKTLSASKSAQIVDGHRFYVNFADAGVKIREYPYIAVGVTTKNIPGTKLDWDTTTDPGKRLWGRKFTVPNDGNISKLIIDGAGYTGGEQGGFNDARRDGAVYSQFEIRPGVVGETANVGETIAFQYVAFFATQLEAENFVYSYTAPKQAIFYADEEGTDVLDSYYLTEEGAAVVLPDEEPTAANKKFVGWYIGEDEVTAQTTIDDISVDFKVYPKFVDAYTVRFMLDDVTEFATDTYVEGDTLVLPTEIPEVDGFVFKGWIDAEEGTEVTASVDYYADWAEAYKAEFYLNEEDVDAYDAVQAEAGLALGEVPAAPVLKGYEFIGWFAEDVEITAETVLESDVVAYAVYEAAEEPVRVIYMLDEKNVFEIVYGTTANVITDLVPTDAISIPGMTFAGWDFANAEGIEAGADLTAIIGTYLTADNFDIKVLPTFETNEGGNEEEEEADLGYVLYTPVNDTLSARSQGAYTGVKDADPTYGSILHFTN
ncbi:MAG: InlB B-repeat-containing protein, partial [Clostridia bacterium]|nr:InlB B-repeat-containing protein [Clostridia bacterium]